MAVACTSRFAVLKLEDDEFCDSGSKTNPSAVQNGNQAGKNKANGKPGANDLKSKAKKKKKTSNEIAELQSLAFGNGRPKHKSSHGGKPVQASQKQWEEWKQKDSEFVSETYEQDLQEALLLSKIDYEEKKDVYDAIQKETAEQTKLGLSKKKKKNQQKKDKGVMSLEEFNSLDTADIDAGNFHKGYNDLDDFDLPPKPAPVDCTNFFEKIEEDAEKIITKEQRQDRNKVVDPVKESARFLQYKEDLRKKDEEIAALNEKVTKLKEELKNVKSRNKKLYGILESGEMREKAEILVQIDQLISVKDELNEQLSEYHTALEQEKSKNHALQTELKKYQGNKKQRTESK